MEKFIRVTGIAAPLPRRNVDTDAIMPKRWCVSISKEGFGAGLFGDWRYDLAGREVPDFVLNREPWRRARILVAGANYGCGSSREMAVWGHLQFGIRAVIAPSFASIFHNNCFKNGLLPVTLPDAVVDKILAELAARPGAEMTVDLVAGTVTAPDGTVHAFAIDPARRAALLEGLDEIGETLRHAAAIDAFQAADRRRRPWAWAPPSTGDKPGGFA
jgi:3-isopropylmalate/(R)-2-methylmalate dehydratase small subunit